MCFTFSLPQNSATDGCKEPHGPVSGPGLAFQRSAFSDGGMMRF